MQMSDIKNLRRKQDNFYVADRYKSIVAEGEGSMNVVEFASP